MGCDLTKISQIESNQSDAAVKLRGRDRKTTFEENGKQPANFLKTVPFYTRVFSCLWGKTFNGQDRRFLHISYWGNAGRPLHRLRRFHWKIFKFYRSWTGLFPAKTGLLQMQSEMRWNSKWLQESRRKTSWPLPIPRTGEAKPRRRWPPLISGDKMTISRSRYDREVLSTGITSIGLWPPQSKSAALRSADFTQGHAHEYPIFTKEMI